MCVMTAFLARLFCDIPSYLSKILNFLLMKSVFHESFAVLLSGMYSRGLEAAKVLVTIPTYTEVDRNIFLRLMYLEV